MLGTLATLFSGYAIAYSQNGYKIPLGQQAIVRNLVDLTDLTTA